jgi:glycosyltransferase involved in cell wall biosynthesis
VAVSALPEANRQETIPEAVPVLAVFCFEGAASPVGQEVRHIVAALAKQQFRVHLFTRESFELKLPGVTQHTVEIRSDGDLVAQVDDFTRRASNAFLAQVPLTNPGGMTLLGYEWSSAQVLSLLHSVKNLDFLLILHSLERQRSDMSSDLNRHIEDIEFKGMREARAVLFTEAATAEIARHWLPECFSRMVPARRPFPVHHFDSHLDPGAIKGRYQVGPVDPTILFIGDLSERYGPDVLMKSLPPVLKNHKQVRCIFVGDGDLYWPLRVYARYLLLEYAVRLVGALEGQPLYELIQAADLIAVPSREATPWWPILAGWAAQRPVVATHAAAPTLLEHERDSVLTYTHESSLVWGLERILFAPDLAQAVGQRGREKLDARFGWNGVAEQIAEMIFQRSGHKPEAPAKG